MIKLFCNSTDIDFTKRFSTDKNVAKTSMTQASIQYQVLCEHTAFFGKIKNKEKSTEEPVTIQIPVSKLKSQNLILRDQFKMNYAVLTKSANIQCRSSAIQSMLLHLFSQISVSF